MTNAKTNNDVMKGLENITVIPTFNKIGSTKAIREEKVLMRIAALKVKTRKADGEKSYTYFRSYKRGMEKVFAMLTGTDASTDLEQQVLERIVEVRNLYKKKKTAKDYRYFRNYMRGMIETYETLTGKGVVL